MSALHINVQPAAGPIGAASLQEKQNVEIDPAKTKKQRAAPVSGVPRAWAGVLVRMTL
jgi:hypothetical protein